MTPFDSSTDASAEPTYRVPSNVVGEELDGEAVLLNLETGIYFGLNQVGTWIWRELRDHGDLQLAIKRVSESYRNVDAQTIRKDACELTAELASRGLLARNSDV